VWDFGSLIMMWGNVGSNPSGESHITRPICAFSSHAKFPEIPLIQKISLGLGLDGMFHQFGTKVW